MPLVPSRPDPFNELAALILEIGGVPIHALPRHPVLGGGTRVRFTIPSYEAAMPIIKLCHRHGWSYTTPSGIQMTVNLPWVPAKPRQPSLGEGQRELPS